MESKEVKKATKVIYPCFMEQKHLLLIKIDLKFWENQYL